MRTLSATLLAAQKAASGVPYVRVVAVNNVRSARHLDFAVDYLDASADDEHDAAADSTYLHRVRVSGSHAQYQRDPGASWTTLTSTATVSHIAVAATGSRVVVFFNGGTGGLGVYFRESTDGGATFGSATLVETLGAVTAAVSVAYTSSGGDVLFLYESDGGLRRTRRTSGVLGTPATWTLSASGVNGVDVVHTSLDNLIAVSGTDDDGRPAVWTCVLGDGVFIPLDVWAQQFILIQAEGDEDVSFSSPFIEQVGADASFRVTYVEHYSGTPSYARTFMTLRHPAAGFPLLDWEWADPWPLDNETDHGLAIAVGTAPDQVYLSRPGKVWAAPTALVQLDLSSDLIDAEIEERDGLRTRARFAFDNSSGQYLGPPAPLALGRDVDVGLGYDAEFSRPPHQSIVGWEYERARGRGRFVLLTEGNAYWLRRSRPRTTVALASIKPTEITRGAASRAGLRYRAIGASTRALNALLDWVIHPHQDSLSALEAVGELLSDVILSGSADFTVTIHNSTAGDSVDYAFGTDHPVYASRTRAENGATFAEVLADGVLGQAFDFPGMANDKAHTDRRRDPHATAVPDAEAHAEALLRKAVLRTDLGELVVPPHVGLEIADVISYSDDLASGSTLTARVRRIVTRYRRAAPGRTPVFDQTVGLGGL